jgi:hypothetical protein
VDWFTKGGSFVASEGGNTKNVEAVATTKKKLKKEMPSLGIEPKTSSLQDWRSAN